MHHLQNILEMWKTHSAQNQVAVSIDQNLKTCIPFASIHTITQQKIQSEKIKCHICLFWKTSEIKQIPVEEKIITLECVNYWGVINSTMWLLNPNLNICPQITTFRSWLHHERTMNLILKNKMRRVPIVRFSLLSLANSNA
jgi:hypothetical protein